MGKKKLSRVKRSGNIRREESARDREIRRKVQEEFPPVAETPIPNSLSETLKRAILESELSVYQIAKKAHVSQIIISRFLSGERDIRVATADKIANALGLKLVSTP